MKFETGPACTGCGKCVKDCPMAILEMKDGRLIVCDTPDAIKTQTGEDSIEKAFIKIVRGENR